MTLLAIELVDARTRPAAVRMALNFEHLRALAGDERIFCSVSPFDLPPGLTQSDIFLGIKTCH
jgi:hypothetical protein